MFCDGFVLQNLRSVSQSSLVSAVMRVRLCATRLDPQFGGPGSWHKSPPIAFLRAIRRGYSFRIHWANGANSSNPAFVF